MNMNFLIYNPWIPSWPGVFQFGTFLSVAVLGVCPHSNPSLSPCSSFFILFLHSVFLLCFFSSHILHQNCFLFLHPIWMSSCILHLLVRIFFRYYYYYYYYSFSYQLQLLGFFTRVWVSRTLLGILADLNNLGSLNSSSDFLFLQTFQQAVEERSKCFFYNWYHYHPLTPCLFYFFGKYLHFNSLSFIFTLCSVGTAKSTKRQVFFLVNCHSVWPSGVIYSKGKQ